MTPKKRSVRRIARRVLLVVVMLVAVAGVIWIRANRTDPRLITQEQWWAMSTHSEAAAFEGLPKQRKVVVPEPTKDLFTIVRDMLPAPLGKGSLGRSNTIAQFDPNTGEIRVVDDSGRFLATMPKQLQGPIVHAIRHEYGHAFMFDWYRAKRLIRTDEQFMAFSDDQETIAPKSYPSALRAVAGEYASVNRGVYALPYFTSSFDDYMAESYARFLGDEYVPPKTKAFFAAAAGEH